MRRKSLLSMVCMLALCTGFIMAAETGPVQVMFYDATGSLVTDAYVHVTDQAGRTVAKLTPASDGVYNLDSALMGQKVVFKVSDPSLGSANTMDARIPEWIQGPVIITLPTPPASPLGVPANDTCDIAIAIAVPSITNGDTIGAGVDNDVVDCETPNTAGGVWYSITGTGNPITLTTCELDTGTPGSADYDTKISVYCLGCGAAAVCVAGNDDTAGGDFCGFTFHSTLTFQSTLGVQYGVLVHGFSTGTGNFSMSAYEGGTPTSPPVSCVPPPPSGACCVQECLDPVFGSCEVTTPDDCAAAGGDYQGDDSECVTPNGTTLSLSASPALAIPDGTSTFVCSTIDVVDPANCDAVSDLDVGVNITHTWIGDLFIDINGPNGETTNMWQNRCGSTDNMDFFFDDEGTDLTCAAVAQPGFGRGAPTVAGLGPALAQFDGLSPEGSWELCVMDTFPADVGTLNSWTLEIDCGSEVCVFLPTPVPSCDPTPTPTPSATPTPDPGHGHGHGGKGGHGWWWGWDDNGDGSVIGLESFGDMSNGDAIDPFISSQPRSSALGSGNDRGPRVPAGDRLPR